MLVSKLLFSSVLFAYAFSCWHHIKAHDKGPTSSTCTTQRLENRRVSSTLLIYFPRACCDAHTFWEGLFIPYQTLLAAIWGNCHQVDVVTAQGMTTCVTLLFYYKRFLF